MKRCVSVLLASLLLLACMFTGGPAAHASQKKSESRAVGIVFDNSGSMYKDGDQAWCRATYAMEVFASMLNEGDILQIYPMHPITVNGEQYTMDKPFSITDADDAGMIRDIYTTNAQGTPIESVDWAVYGLKLLKADKKYMIVLTDGNSFYRQNVEMSKAETRKQLESRFSANVGPEMSIMYLGIGNEVVMPDMAQSEYFSKKQAKNSTDVLSALTEMCNQIFGRDTLAKENISGKKINFDISMSKLIVFVQGRNVSNLKVVGSGGSVGRQLSATSTKYGTAGCGNYASVPDESLQGMMVTYEDCAAGSYTVEYSGTATSMEVYYEPNADLDFVFTDANGNTVDPKALYEGEYKVSFGMKDAKTGKLISSKLLGNPRYQGSYSINGKSYPITHNGYNGSVPIKLNMGDTFDAKLTVTYLGGYTINKDSSDFGWPSIGIKVAPRPAGNLRLVIDGGEPIYYLQEMDGTAPFRAKVYYQDKQLTGTELGRVALKWDPADSNAMIKSKLTGDCYELYLSCKDASDPQKTPCGECVVPITATYTAKGSNEANAAASMTYEIAAARPAGDLQMEITGGAEVYSLQDLEKGAPFVVKLFYQGKQLTGAELGEAELFWQPESSNAILEKTLQEDCFSIALRYKDPEAPQDTACGDCRVQLSASYTAPGCFESQAEGSLAYNIVDDRSPLQMQLDSPESYIVISKLDESLPLTVTLTFNGALLPPEEFAATVLRVDCSGISYEVTPLPQDSAYSIKLLPTEGIGEGDYNIRVNAQHTDHIGRVTEVNEETLMTLGVLPVWLKLLLWLLLLILLFLIIWTILHIRVMPKHVTIRKTDATMIVGGDDVTPSASFPAEIEKKKLKVSSKYAGQTFGLTMDVKPGRESYLYKPQHKRSIEVKPSSVRKTGPAVIQDAMLASTKFVYDETLANLGPALPNTKPFELKHKNMVKYSGVMDNAGVQTDIEIILKPSFKK